ncbi:hypothetical protein D0812_21240 [Vibrio owensii]|uniref:ASP external chaperone domain-containing protein n=2 Tax=Vibrio harveyi group TaxID=717610 RepID=A0AAP9GFX8_9VIBR|nr:MULTISPECIES: hypothetical protein [Vibrio]AYO16920.1 hypothetical protein D0812_21240 [Vibrio owensii]AYO22874.1 hypothetical protein D0856_23355 [Vibrio owensii]EKM26716.1 hypothetical protein VCHENC03_4318 [Vibrio sp. HENC-03]KIF49708.1 hypothetical protein M445_02390 [Vibrio owensii 47666-1]MCR9942331.1 hypothetical protein [Vibrio owensii]
MKFMTFSILALSTMATAVHAEQQLAEQPAPELFVASDAVEINGQDYRKLSVDNLSEAAELHAGDEVFKNAFSNVSKATGLIFVTVKNPADAKAVAKELKLDVVFAQGESAVFKASEGQDLLGISDYLNADSRVKASKIELNSGKFRAQ